ncbi:MAG TPA: hypothetical protein VIC51_08320 [Psychromonas sp.]
MKSVSDYEEKGRLLAKDLLKQSTQYKWIKDTYNQYSIYDQVWQNLSGVYILVEIKVRSCKMETYNSALLEAVKYDALKDASARYGCLIYYVNFYNDGVKIYDISDLSDYKKTQVKAPKKTFVNKEDKTSKEIYELMNDKLIHKITL